MNLIIFLWHLLLNKSSTIRTMFRCCFGRSSVAQRPWTGIWLERSYKASERSIYQLKMGSDIVKFLHRIGILIFDPCIKRIYHSSRSIFVLQHLVNNYQIYFFMEWLHFSTWFDLQWQSRKYEFKRYFTS